MKKQQAKIEKKQTSAKKFFYRPFYLPSKPVFCQNEIEDLKKENAYLREMVVLNM